MVVYFSAAAKSDEARYVTAVFHVDGKKVSKVNSRMLILDGRQRRRWVRRIEDESRLMWAAEQLRMRYGFCIDNKAIAAAQVIILAK